MMRKEGQPFHFEGEGKQIERKEDVLKRHADRKKMNNSPYHQNHSAFKPYFYEHPAKPVQGIPKKKGTFLLKMTIASMILLLSIAFHRGLIPVKKGWEQNVSQTLWTDFQFSRVQKWYEQKTNGNPLALLTLPFVNKSSDTTKTSSQSTNFELPVNGQVTKTYNKETNGITIRAQKDTAIKAIEDGVVTFSGKKEDTGNTIIIQHANGTESLYGNVSSVTVEPYQQVKKGEKVAEIHPANDELYGVFYFALKKNKHFIDPLQVIPFD